ncbi:GNAT family N-acetyltransferase [Thauera sp. 2A1]|uniref:GNAT family N-acetyltransferase n=1 Tax=Thauera sp. 2A1 TaxID=2570191 RepID=UPI001D16FC37|nr:N-acetyltransferase [Thauera sp. 2A1]KAI5914027.1 GNAT family N-acetyltransferase [Thauera sp. 2A1]
MKFEYCMYGGKIFDVEPANVPGVRVVDNGWVTVIGYQANGYSLMPASLMPAYWRRGARGTVAISEHTMAAVPTIAATSVPHQETFMAFELEPCELEKMNSGLTIHEAAADDAWEVAILVGELLAEIMHAIGTPAFNFDLTETATRLADFLSREKYFVFVARDAGRHAVGFVSLCESCSLYAEGTFGTMQELYVRPEFRSKKLGLRLVSQAKSFAMSRGWRRLEVTTPPLPEFDRTLAFYEREGFSVTGGRKLKLAL